MKTASIFMCFFPWIVGAVFTALDWAGLVVTQMPPLLFVASFWLVISPAITALAIFAADCAHN